MPHFLFLLYCTTCKMSIKKYYKNVLTIGAPSVARLKYRILADGLKLLGNCSKESKRNLLTNGNYLGGGLLRNHDFAGETKENWMEH